MLWAICLLLGMWWFQVFVVDFNDTNKIYHYNDQEVELVGRVVKVDKRINQKKLTLRSQSVSGYPVNGQVLVTTSLYPEYSYGDELLVRCKLKRPEKFDDFDYEKYLARYDVYSICWSDEINKLVDSRGNRIFGFIFNIKEKLSDSLNLSIKEPQVSILQAMILGNRRGIPKDIGDQFSDVGVSHIVAISGMHVAIIVMILMYLAIGVGIIRQKAFWVATGGIIFYVIMIGAPASAVRAAIMAILVLYAQKIGRLSSSINIIILAAAVMLVINPKLLLSDVGFQLSFAAVIGIIYLYPIFQKYLERLPETLRLKDMIAVTLSAQIMTLPLIIFYFHKLSLVAAVANILILPIVPFLMMWGLFNSIVGVFWLPASRMIGFVSWLGASYILKISEWLAALSFSHIEIRSVSIFVVIVLYGVIAFWIIGENKDNNKLKN